MVKFDVFKDVILSGNKGVEPTVVNVHTEKKIKRKRKGVVDPYLLSPQPKIRYIVFYYSRGGDLVTIRPSFGYKKRRVNR